mgnify:CR=1 FL=1
MAVNKSGSDKNQNQPNQNKSTMGAAFEEAYQNAAQQGSAQASQTNAKPRGTGRRGSFMDINSTMRRPMSRKSTGEIVVKFQDVLNAQMERNFKEGFENAFKLLVLDNNTNNIGPLSCLLVCYNEGDFLAVYTLLVEASGDPLKPKVINLNNQNIQIDTVPGDVFTNYLWSKITDYVQSAYGRRFNVIDAGALVLPSELEPEDEEHMRQVMFNASQACFTIMENNVGGKEEPFTIAEVNSGSESLVARLSYSPTGDQSETATGLPVRSDVHITLEGSLNGSSSEDGFEQVMDLATIDGYVDLVYSPPAPVAPNQPVQTQHYYPRFVITRADTQIDAITMETILLSLAQSTLLSRNGAWAGVFRQRHDVKGMDTRDIGAIGYEVNLSGDPQAKPDRIDTKAKSFDLNALYQLVTAAINGSLMYSMDVEEVGDLSWIHQAFIASANGNNVAYQLIADAANTLTMGHFANHFTGGPITINDNNRIHLGYYIDSKGQHRDLRDIDYLAMLNLAGKDDPATVVKWGETFDNHNIPMEVRLETRAKILKSVLGQNVHFKGYAQRINFAPDFIIALNKACTAAGLVIRPDKLIPEFGSAPTRGNFNAAQFGISGNEVNNLFNYGGNAWGNVHQSGMGFQGRFGRG